MAHDAARGHLFGLWVTDPLDGGGVRLEGDRLALLPGGCVLLVNYTAQIDEPC